MLPVVTASPGRQGTLPWACTENHPHMHSMHLMDIQTFRDAFGLFLKSKRSKDIKYDTERYVRGINWGIIWGMNGALSWACMGNFWGKSGASSGKCLGHHLGHAWGVIWGMSGALSGACLGHHLRHVWGIIWGMSEASSGACLGHV